MSSTFHITREETASKKKKKNLNAIKQRYRKNIAAFDNQHIRNSHSSYIMQVFTYRCTDPKHHYGHQGGFLHRALSIIWLILYGVKHPEFCNEVFQNSVFFVFTQLQLFDIFCGLVQFALQMILKSRGTARAWKYSELSSSKMKVIYLCVLPWIFSTREFEWVVDRRFFMMEWVVVNITGATTTASEAKKMHLLLPTPIPHPPAL